ncbi:TPR repeat-containing protein YvcD [Pullulanibacillus camelliae]|uniref:TPR repeat-containing protein YvcD n=1 Tax=Pullulanibacillus camelliae TaxID=1707096 RepID=A0A8J2VQ73_9BACL|nr:tetratricopeptide repeat protein [Pullulanibacillus camelliae]GGE36544.1 TPR repeat-containing protein YvcD [Pullulanibacillus camelliae]
MKTEHSSKKSQVISFIPNGDYYFQKGITAYQKGDLARAKKFVNRAIAFNPNETEYLCQQAAILAELEEYNESNTLLKKVIYELDENMTECYFFLANNFAHLGNYEEALKEVKQYIASEPNGGFIEEAHELYKILILESDEAFFGEDSHVVDHEKGRQALERGEFWEAIAFFKKVIDQRSTYWAAYNNLAIAYYSLGKTKVAFDILEEVLQKDPGNIHALCNRMTFYFQLKQFDRVESLYTGLLNLYPLYPEHRSKLGSTFFFLGEYEFAYRWLKSAEPLGAWDQTFYYWLAVSAYRVGKKQEALKAWKRVDFFSDSPFAPFEYGKIQELLKAEDAEDNPLVHSLLEQQLEAGQEKDKVFALFMLSSWENPASQAILDAFSQRDSAEESLRTLAHLLKDRQAASQDCKLQVMFGIEKKLGAGKPLVDYYGIYLWWYKFYTLDVHVKEDIDVSTWAAVIAYYWQKAEGITVSQLEVAEMYGTTLYRVRKLLNVFKQH